MQAAIFLDRDGVINEDRKDYVKHWSEFRFIKGSLKALRQFQEAGIPVVIISNQSAISRGLITKEKLEALHGRMVKRIQKKGGFLSGIYYCPHHPDDGCTCRKPRTGLLKRAAQELNLDLTQGIFIGDSLKDIQAGQRAGLRTVLVLSGQGKESLKQILALKSSITPHLVVPDLQAAVPLALSWIQGGVLRTL